MDFLWIILGALLLLAGIIGCFLPALPGPPLAYLSLLLLQLTERKPYSLKFLIIWALVVIVVTILDYIIPPYATKKFGGSRMGVIGSTLGVIAGIFIIPPWGIIIFPFLGAFTGELFSGKNRDEALKAAKGSFLGFIGGVFLKLIVSLVIGYYFIIPFFQ